MTTEIKTKTRPSFAVASTGTALGTCSAIIDVSSWQYLQVMSIHEGTGGSRTVSVYVNPGSAFGTASTTLPNPTFVGSGNSDQAGAGSPIFTVGSMTDQAIITYGTSTNSSFSITYIGFD